MGLAEHNIGIFSQPKPSGSSFAGTVTAIGSKYEFDTTEATLIEARIIDLSNILVAWQNDSDQAVYMRIFGFDTSDGSFTPKGTAKNIMNSGKQKVNKGAQDTLDISVVNGGNHAIVKWMDSYKGDNMSNVYSLNTSTGAINQVGSTNFYTVGMDIADSKLATTGNYLIAGGAPSVAAEIEFGVLSFNTTTGNVSKVGSGYESTNQLSQPVKVEIEVIDDDYFLATWTELVNSGNEGRRHIQAFSYNTSNGNVSAIGSSTVIGDDMTSSFVHFVSLAYLEGDYAVITFGNDGTDTETGYTQLIEFNTSTGAITLLDVEKVFHTSASTLFSEHTKVIKMRDGVYVITFAGSGSDGYARVCTYSTSSESITIKDQLEFDTANGEYNYCVRIDDDFFINCWSGSGDDGFMQVFQIA